MIALKAIQAVFSAGVLLLVRLGEIPGSVPAHGSSSLRISVALAYRLSLSISRQRTTISLSALGISAATSIGGLTCSVVRLYIADSSVSAL